MKGEKRRQAGKKENKEERIVLKILWTDHCLGQ